LGDVGFGFWNVDVHWGPCFCAQNSCGGRAEEADFSMNSEILRLGRWDFGFLEKVQNSKIANARPERAKS
jgi:hypothetical protein